MKVWVGKTDTLEVLHFYEESDIKNCSDKNRSMALAGVWLSGLSACLRTKGSPVQFPDRAHAWVSGQIHGWGGVRGNRSMYLSHIDVSLPLSFSLPSLLSENR